MAKRLFYAILIIAALALPVVAGIQKGSGGGTASEVYVDNSTGGWTGDDAQAVLEEIQASIAAYATSAGVSDDAYDATAWNGSTTLAPSQNAVRDKIEAVVAALASPAAHYLTDQAEGSLSAEVVVSANGKALVTAANYAAMKALLDLEIGTDIQAYDADLTTYAGITPSATVQTFLTSADASTARNNLGLSIGSNVQAYDADLTSLASGITGLVKGAGNGGGYSAAAAGTDYVAVDADLTSIAGGITGLVKGAGNGSGFSAAVAGTDYLAPAAIGVTVQGLDADLTALAGISGSRGDIIYYGAAGWTRLPKGTENYILTQGANDPAWAANSGGAGASAFEDLTDIAVNSSTAGPVWWDGTQGRAIKAGVAGSYLKSDGTFDTPAGAGDMLAASYPNIVTLESEPVTNTYMLVADGSQWQSVAPADARTALGLVIGTNVQAYDADLTTFAGITPSANVQSLLGCADYSAMRTALGLAIGTNVQAYDADLATWAGVTPSANGQSLVAAADYSAMRTLLSLVPGTNVQAYDADLATLAAPTANRIYYSNGSQAQTAVALGAANTVFVGNGTTSAPGFRALGVADLPTITPAIGGTGVANGANNTITFTGNYTLGLTLSNNTAVTLPTTGTLATLAGSEALTNKSVNGVTLSAASAYTLTVPGTGTAALTSNKLSAFAATTSAELAGVISDETGSGALVLATSPTLVTPTIGAATMTSLVQSGQTIGSNIIVTNGFSVDADGDVTGKSFTTPQAAATAGEAVLYAAEATPSGLYTSLKGPASAPSGGAYSFQFTNTLPSAGQSFKFGTVSSRIVPLEYTTYAELTGATFTGAVQLPAVGTSQHSLILPHGTAHSSPTNGEIWTTTSGLYARINGSTVGPFLASGSTTLDGVGNPGDNKVFTMGAYTLEFTSHPTPANATATWGGVTISQTHADPSAGALLSLGYTADGDAQTVFLDCLDNSSGDSKFKVGQHGILAMPDASAYIALGADPADQGVLRLANATVIAWEDATECTLTHVDNTGLSLNLALAVGGALTVTGNILPGSAGGSDLGSTAAEWDDLYLHDGAVIYGQADQSATLTSSASTWTASNLASTGTLQAGTVCQPDAAGGATLGSTSLEWSGLYLADGGVIYFQNDQSVYLTPSAGTLTLTGAFVADSISTTRTTDPQYMRLYEGNGEAGDNYIQFTAVAMSANQAYDYPSALPATDGLVLTCTSAGVMSWSTGSTGSGIASLVEDTTPQLGGDLDLNGHTITSFVAADFALAADADAGDFDIKSIDGLYGVDDDIYIDMGTNGYLDLEADTGIRMLGPVDMGANALDCDSNTVTLSTVAGAIDAGGATSLEIPNSDDPDVDATGEISLDTDGWLRVYQNSLQKAIPLTEEIHVTVVKPNDLADAQRDKFPVWSNDSGMTFVVTAIEAWSDVDNSVFAVYEYAPQDWSSAAATVEASVDTGTTGTSVANVTVTSIDNANIDDGNMIILDFDDTDDPGVVKITIRGYYLGDVN